MKSVALRASVCLLGLAAVPACSGKVIDSTPPDKEGAGGAGASSHGDGAATGSGGESIGGGVGAGGRSTGGGVSNGGNVGRGGAAAGGVMGAGGNECDQLSNEAEAFFEKALSADQSCVTDDDCVYGTMPSCLASCGQPIVSKKGALALQSAANAAMPVCAKFTDVGCFTAPLPCALQFGGPGCVSNHCRNIISAAWTSITFEVTTRPSSDCNPNNGCSHFSVTPDGQIVFFDNGGVSVTKLTTAALQQFDKVARDPAFRQSFDFGFNCPATMESRAATVTRNMPDGSQVSQNVTGCLFPVPRSGDVETLFTLIENAVYPPVDAGVVAADGG